MDYIRDLIGGRVSNVELEEVELSENGMQWLVTIGFDKPIEKNESLRALFGPSARQYKQVVINRDTGEAVAMRIRKI